MNKLIAFIEQRGKTEYEVAKAINMSINEFKHTLTNMEFNREQIRGMILFLDMTEKDYINIFFA